MLSAVRQRDRSLQALLRSGHPVGVEGNALLVGFDHQFHKSRVEEEANRRMVEEALTQLLGHPVRVRCVLTSTPQPAPTPSASSASEDDHLVQAAVEKLGARVVDQS